MDLIILYISKVERCNESKKATKTWLDDTTTDRRVPLQKKDLEEREGSLKMELRFVFQPFSFLLQFACEFC